jgi:hypothetical protein
MPHAVPFMLAAAHSGAVPGPPLAFKGYMLEAGKGCACQRACLHCHVYSPRAHAAHISVPIVLTQPSLVLLPVPCPAPSSVTLIAPCSPAPVLLNTGQQAQQVGAAGSAGAAWPAWAGSSILSVMLTSQHNARHCWGP